VSGTCGGETDGHRWRGFRCWSRCHRDRSQAAKPW
jgi:hypothetical protein